jgi:YQGE family putative transporter
LAHTKAKGDKRLSREAKILLVVGCLFTIATSLSGTFVNVYLWRAKNDFAMIGTFNFVQYLAIPAAFYIGGRMTRKHSAGLCLRIGLILHLAFFLSILAANRKAPSLVIPLGILLGFAAGFYWVSSQILTFDLTSRMNRDTYNSTLGILFSISNMLSPLASGYIISTMQDFKGYRLIFLISAAIYTAIWLISHMLTAQPYDHPLNVLECWKKAPSAWRYTMLGHGFFGIRNGVLMFLINLLVFITTNNEFVIGKLALTTSITSILTFWILGKILKPKRRVLIFTVGAVMMLFSVSIIAFRVHVFSLFAYGIVNSIFVPYFSVPFESATMNVIDKNSSESRTEYIILKEISLNIGRIVGVLSFMLVIGWNNSPTVLRAFLLAMGSVQLALLLFRKKLDFDENVLRDI